MPDVFDKAVRSAIMSRVKGKDNLRELKRLGWKCLVIWECQLKHHGRVAARIERFLS